jgi:hypothetical protein
LKRTNTIFNYSQTNQVEYKSLKNHIARVVNLEALTNTNGSLRFNHHVEFDTSGRRKSGINDIQSNLPGIESRLNKIDFFTYLSPSRERGYFVASRELLSVNSSWSTNRVHYHLDFKSIHNGNYSTTKIHSIDSFMRIHSKTFGDFYFDVKHKKLNEKSFYDIRLSKYRVRGPLNALYSLAIPGLGSSRVSYGEVGKSRLGGFLLFSALSVGSQIYSSIQYNKYMQATNQAEIESLYMKSNIANKVFLVSGGIAVSFYLYDFVWAVNRGVKNLSNTRELKRQIKTKEFFIQKSDLSW